MLPEGMRAMIRRDSYEVPAVFRLLQREGNIAEDMMYNTYNMGIGMVLAVAPGDGARAAQALRACGETVYELGTIAAGEKGISLC